LVKNPIRYKVGLLIAMLSIAAAFLAIGCQKEETALVVRDWAQAVLDGDLEQVQERYVPDNPPDGHLAFEREFRETIEAGAEVTYELMADLEPGRATVTVRTVTAGTQKTWLFRLRDVEGKWLIFSLDRYFD
jgi:hypothetical protein